jgi:hypothetical protein
MNFSAKRLSPYIFLGLALWIALLIMSQVFLSTGGGDSPMLNQSTASSTPRVVVEVSDHVIGRSTQYIGAVEGNIAFNPDDLDDLGINTYRIYGGMSRWEPEDDDGVYGWPAIADIKLNPNLINWTFWDQAMTRPRYGSDYSWSGKSGEVWSGSAVTLLSTLKAKAIRPVLTLRNVDNSQNPPWAQQLNPPNSEADWNEWWAHVFATVYWLNVRNNYHVDEFEIHNEPDNRDQGWRGSVEDYYELVRVSKDAIDHVYRTYLPDRQYFIHAPVSLGGSQWPLKVLRNIPDLFDSLNIHDYDADISVYAKRVRDWANHHGHSQSPLWVGEWGSYTNDYDNYPFALNLIQNMMRASQPSPSYVFGSHIFSLYDWGVRGKHEGLIGLNGKRRLSYYAFRLGTRALQGGKAVLEIQPMHGQPMTMATQNDDGHLFVLLVNSDQTERAVTVNVSAHLKTAQGQRWEFSRDRFDESLGSVIAQNGIVEIVTPPESATLLELELG